MLAALLLAGAALAPAPPPAPAPELRVVVESLDLAFTTPKNWCLQADSTTEEVRLQSRSRRGLPLLRIRRMPAGPGARERMRQVALTLDEPESSVEFASEEPAKFGKREGTLVRGTMADGLSLRLVVLPGHGDAEYVFWFVGRESTLDRQWEDLAAFLAGCTHPGAASSAGGKFGGRSFRDAKSGLVLATPPPGMELDGETRARLSKDGLVFRAPGDDPDYATLHVRRTVVGPLVTAQGAAGSYGAELRGRPEVRDLLSKRERVAGLQAVQLSWNTTERQGRAWFFKRGDALFRIELGCAVAWFASPGVAEGLEQFVAGVSFADAR